MGLRIEIEELLKKADSIFKEKWSVLCFLKEPTKVPDIGKAIIDFQINLAEVLFEIEKFRQKITTEETRLKYNKQKYNEHWFVARMKTLANYKKILLKFNVTGKSIGDAFAFWFYRFDLDLLNEHFNHKRTLYPPLGIGGTGELEFVRKIRFVDGKIGIYHGITNILRIGDVSFFDFENLNISSIGELKTKKTGENKISINLIILGPKGREWFKDRKKAKPKPLDLDYFDKERLNRQLKSMGDALQVYVPSKSNLNIDQNIEEEFNCSAIEKLYASSSSNKISFIQVSEGLLYSGIKSTYKNSIKKYFNSKPYKLKETETKDASDNVLKIIKNTSSQNCMIYGQLQYNQNELDNAIRGAIPLFWMPIKNEILKDIYFEDFEVMVIFNPVHLIEKLISKNVMVESKYYKNGEHIENVSYPKITAEYFDLYIPYIMSFLQSEQSIVKIFELIKSEFANKKGISQTRIEIRMQQKVAKYMTKPCR